MRGAWLAAVALLGVAAGCGESRAAGPQVGDPAPPLIDVSWIPRFKIGTEPSDFLAPPLDGQVVLLEFFASW